MHEIERHRVILSEVEARPIVTVAHLADVLGASEATVRRDIGFLDKEGKLRRVRGGAEAINPPSDVSLLGRPYSVSQTINTDVKRCIAKAAVDLLSDNMSIMISGGTTTSAMSEYMRGLKLQVLTNSFSIADQLIKKSKCSVTVPSGKIHREQNIILSPFPNDISNHTYADILFIGAYGVNSHGVMETDPQIVQAVMKLINRADQRVLLVDSTKFQNRSSMIICPLSQIDIVITDDGIDNKSKEVIKAAGCRLIIVEKQKQ
jgi:DeoR family ulaG and ulaABCDEF operon transcriptional repressor